MDPVTPPSPKDAVQIRVASPEMASRMLSGHSLPPAEDLQAIPSRIAPRSLRSHYFGIFDIYSVAGAPQAASEVVNQYLNRWARGYLIRVWDDGLAIGQPKLSRIARQGEVDYSSLWTPPEKNKRPIEAFALEHTDREETGRRWRTEVVIIPMERGVRLYVGVHHGLRVDYIGGEPRPPDPSMPAFVRGLINEPDLECLTNGVRVSAKPLSVKDSSESGDFFARYLANEKRSLPVILVNPLEFTDRQRFTLDPYRLAQSIVGAGTVVVPSVALRRTGPFLRAVEERLSHGYTSGLSDGGIRVYLPLVDPSNPKDAFRHRYFKPQDEPAVESIIRESLFRCGQSEVAKRGDTSTFDEAFELCEEIRERAKWRSTLESIESVTKNSREHVESTQAALQVSNLSAEALMQENGALRQENGRLQNLIADLQPKIVALQEQAAGIAGEKRSIKMLREELAAAEELMESLDFRARKVQEQLEAEEQLRHQAESKAAALREALDAKEVGDEGRRELRIPLMLPKNPVEVVKYLQKMLKPRVVILDNALNSAKELSPELSAETWRYLVALHQELWPLHFNDSEMSELADEESTRVRIHKIPARFMAATSIDYVLNESSTTQKQDKFMRLRRAIVDGVEHDFTPHLRGGSHPDFLRIHFTVDDRKKRILVWHVGGHLDTEGTRRRGY